jgi:hypothetical protein
MLKRTAFLACAALLLAGCMTIGRPFRTELVSRIELGKTDEGELLRLFGPPYRRGVDDGDRTWTWLQYKLRVFGTQRTRDLYVRFDGNGKVRSYSFNSNFDEDVVE